MFMRRSSSTIAVPVERVHEFRMKKERFDKARRGLWQRRNVHKNRSRIVDYIWFINILSVLIVVIESELTAQHILSKQSTWSLILKSFCCISTCLLLCLIVLYHACEVQLIMIDSGTDDWRVALDSKRVSQIILELLVCGVCPLPGVDSNIYMPYLSPEQSCGKEITRPMKHTVVPLDVLLAVPMFLRIYLVGRLMVVHSHSFQDAATRSIAALNRVSVDFKFVLKTLMKEHPLRVIVTFTIAYWLCVSWFFTQCERYAYVDSNITVSATYFNSLWLIVISFLSIGYGDIVPHTYCGRLLAISTGVVGIGVASALIAVVTRMLNLSKPEKQVNAFMADSMLSRRRKNAAASVLQNIWFIHKYRSKHGDQLKTRLHQRKFLAAITEFRKVKWEQRKLSEKSDRLNDVSKVYGEIHQRLAELQRGQHGIVSQVEKLTHKLNAIQNRRNSSL